MQAENVILFGELRCHKTRFYRDALKARGVDFHLAELDKSEGARMALTALTGSASKFPTLLIDGRKVRNPSLKDLGKELTRAGLVAPELVHEKTSQRFVRYARPSDFFASYSWREDRMVVAHVEVPKGKRGKGFGTRFAQEVIEDLARLTHEVRLTCPFLRKVAATRPEWRAKFGLKEPEHD